MTIALDSLRMLAALALPPRCPGCAVPVEADHRFCAECWFELRFIGPPWCATCNVPFAYDRGEGTRCAACLTTPPLHSGVRAAVAYGPIARRLALRLKYGGRIGVAATMAGLMLRNVPAEAGLILPVPLHRWRLWLRGYNQAGLIADALAKRLGKRAYHDVLVRTRHTAALRGLDGKGRRRTVARAFAVAQPEVVQRRHVLLVDDVHTSGATADGCTRVLLKAGAASVTVACWARVLDDTVD